MLIIGADFHPHSATHRDCPIPWKTFVREITDTLAPTEEQAANLAVESRRAAIAVMQYLFQPSFCKPIGTKTGRTTRRETAKFN